MPITNSGLSSFLQGIEQTKIDIEEAIDEGTTKNCKNVCLNAYFSSRRDTGTLKASYQINEDETIRAEGEHQKQAWSDPSIIATNPKHPNGIYYAYDIEYGWVDKAGIFHEGDHMWESASTLGKHDLRQDLIDEIKRKTDYK